MNLALTARALVARATGPAIATDEKNRIVSWNRAARDLVGYGAEREPIGENLHQVTRARDAAGNRFGAEPLDFLGMVGRGEAIRPFEIEVRRTSGESVRALVSVVVVVDREREKTRLIYLLQPVLRRRKADEAIDRILADGTLVVDRGRNAAPTDRPRLTERQSEVLGLLAQGKSVEEIAAGLGIALSTVRSHVRRLLEKLEVRSQVEAVARAFRDRLV